MITSTLKNSIKDTSMKISIGSLPAVRCSHAKIMTMPKNVLKISSVMT
jgi:light-regulated signal transduction histidine kinase (bacteriophytochrome)